MTAILKLNQQRLYEQAKSLQSQNDVIVVVKNDAYNFGMERAFTAFYQAGIKSYATTNLSEAIWLRKQDKEIMILLLDPSTEFNLLKKYDITLTVPNLTFYNKYKTQLKGIKVQLVYKNLLNRFGFDHSEEMLQVLKEDYVEITGIWTHFAFADDLTEPKYEIEKNNWLTVLKHLKDYIRDLEYIHAQNSASYTREGLLEGHTHIRPGAIAYGALPYFDKVPTSLPAQTIEVSASVKDIVRLKKGHSAGYSAAFVAEKDTSIAICDIGYGNGIMKNRAKHEVLINGKLYPIVVLMMSHLMVEVDEQVNIEDIVILYNDQLRLDEFAYKGVGAISEQMASLNRHTFNLIEIPIN